MGWGALSSFSVVSGLVCYFKKKKKKEEKRKKKKEEEKKETFKKSG